MVDNPERGTHRIVSMILENYLEFWGIFCQQGLAGNTCWTIRKYKNCAVLITTTSNQLA